MPNLSQLQKYQIKSTEQWTSYGKKNAKHYIFYKGYCLDLTQFKNFHPGGNQAIKNFLFLDITDILFTVFPHDVIKTEKRLEQYRIGKVKEQEERLKPTGTILRSRRDDREKENSGMKKSVQFPSDVNKRAAEKERMQDSKVSSRPKHKAKSRHSRNKTPSTKHQRKHISQSSLSKLKPSPPDHTASKFLPTFTPLQITTQLSNNHSTSSSEQILLTDHNDNIETVITNNLLKTSSPPPTYDDDSHPKIKVPVLVVKQAKQW